MEEEYQLFRERFTDNIAEKGESLRKSWNGISIIRGEYSLPGLRIKRASLPRLTRAYFVLAGPLRLIQGLIGVFDQRIDVIAVARSSCRVAGCDAHAQRNFPVRIIRNLAEGALLDTVSDPLGQCACAHQIGFRKNNAEFLASEPARDITIPDELLQESPNLPESRIA